MKLLAFDPGAKRCGFALVEDSNDGPIWNGSGILGLDRSSDEKFQEYRLRLIKYWTIEAAKLFKAYRPDAMVNEIIPAVGGGNFIVATQSHLAAAAITVITAVAYQNKIPVSQIGATTVKKNIGGSNKATKIQVRNGVYNLMPDLKNKRKDKWKKVYDESDACAIALTKLGYKNG